MYAFNSEYTFNYSSLSEAIGIQRKITNNTNWHVYRKNQSLRITFSGDTKDAILNGLNYVYKLSTPCSFSFNIRLKNIRPHIAKEAIEYAEETKLDIEKIDSKTLKVSGHDHYIDALNVFDIVNA